MKASVTNSLTSGPHAEIDEISYHGVVAAENWGARAPRALFRRLAKTNFGSNRVAHPFGVQSVFIRGRNHTPTPLPALISSRPAFVCVAVFETLQELRYEQHGLSAPPL